jgi:uncharacterized protein YjeT (DUF2065 family)
MDFYPAWLKWIDLAIGISGLLYLLPPHRLRDIGSAIICIGFLVRFVMHTL